MPPDAQGVSQRVAHFLSRHLDALLELIQILACRAYTHAELLKREPKRDPGKPESIAIKSE
jgi:hypothetical protein